MLVRSVSVPPKTLYLRKQSFLRKIRSLVKREDKFHAGGQFLSFGISNAFLQGVPGDPALLARQYSLLFMESPSYDWVKKPVIWGLEYRQQGAKALNVVSGPGILAGDDKIGWMGNSGWQPLITQDVGITNLISGLPFRNRLCFSLLSNWMLSIPIAIACQVVQHSIASVSSHI